MSNFDEKIFSAMDRASAFASGVGSSVKGGVDRLAMFGAGFWQVDSGKDNKEMLVRNNSYITSDDAARMYINSPIAHAATDIVANLLSLVPLRVYQTSVDQKATPKIIKRGYPFELLDWVNPNMTPTMLIQNTVSWMMLDGNAFWAIEPTPTKCLGYAPEYSIYPLNPRFVRIQPDPDTGVKCIVYEVNGQRIYYPYDKVIHFRGFNPIDHWYGNSRMNSLVYDMQIERHAKKEIRQRFQQGTVIDGVIAMTKEIGSDEFLKLKKEFREQYAGAKNSHRLLLLEQGMTFTAVNPRAAEQGVMELLQGPIADAHSMVFGVPLSVLLGMTKDMRDSKGQDAFMMWNKTIMPIGQIIEEMLTKKMCRPLKKRLYIGFDYRNVAAVQIYKFDKSRTDVAYKNSGLRTINEIRADNGEDPLNDAEHGAGATEMGNMPAPLWESKYGKPLTGASASMTLDGSEGGRDQSATGEAQLIDETGTR